MSVRGLYRVVVLTVAGGMLFQTTASCSSGALDSLVTSLMPTLSSALQTAITGASQCDNTTSTTGSISPPTNSVFNTVTNAAQGLQSQLGAGTGQTGGTSSSGGAASASS